MPNKTIYLRPCHAALWERAVELAKLQRISMSELIERALAELLDKKV